MADDPFEMELTHLNQIDFRELLLEKIDCVITASGNQPRCLFIPEKLHKLVSKKILLTCPGNQKRIGDKHQHVFTDYGFTTIDLSTDEPKVLEYLLKAICDHPAHHINIVVDYSCMPKKWYALIIDCITRSPYATERLNLYLAYTPKVFDRNPTRKNIDYIGPIVLHRDHLKDKKPVSMIASLDNNHNSLQEAISKIKPQKLLAFIPHCIHDPEYTRLVMENNKSLLGRLDSNCIINYDMDRPEEINTLLTSYCLDERIASEVMIMPQGPKTFSMMSMLLSVRYPDVKLWEVILKDQKHTADHGLPAANPVIVKVSFLNDELD